MPILREHLETQLPIEQAFDFVADFANASIWDPGVASSEAVGDRSLRVGSRYRLGVRVAGSVRPMAYRVTSLERPSRVVLTGEGSGVDAVDDIRFERTADGGTAIDYTADIRLHGLLRLTQPFAGGAFAAIARNARDGMQRTLDVLAATAGAKIVDAKPDAMNADLLTAAAEHQR